MMDKILGVLAFAGELKVRYDDDWVDRLNRTYTTFFLVIFAILVSSRQYVGEPISCWVPAQFTHNHEEYANKVCWVTNTYYLPFKQKTIPDEDDQKLRISYYQWIPMILICQASLFYIPAILWRVASRHSGLNVKTVLETCANSQRINTPEARQQSIHFAISYMESYLNAKPPAKNTCWFRIKMSLSKKVCLVCGRIYGNYLAFLYIGVKFLYILNSVGQLFMLSVFLGIDYRMFGVKVLISIFKGEEWISPSRFPRVTLCDFEVRQLGNTHRHTVQCVLPINLFNEKIFVFVWFWLVFVSIVNIFSWGEWLLRTVRCGAQTDYVVRHLMALDKISREHEARTAKFVHDFLRQDGVFIAQLIAKNAGDIIAAEILAGLWEIYLKHHRLVTDGLNETTGIDSMKATDPIFA